MKVILINGSPKEKGCTYTALREIERQLQKNNIETEIFWLGNKPISGCIGCGSCLKTGECFMQDKVNEFLEKEERIVRMLRTVFDPEIPVNIYDLGLIYRIDVKDDGVVDIDMTLTAPNCPAVDFIVEDVIMKVESVEGITKANVNIVFDPPWDKDMMSEEAQLELGFL